ncbi:MAG: MBL fold metallo-hydrolase [Clostridia bacterium]|nr:MBL fold metallo-hydrolase [Clostridia bacterium]
MIKAGAYPQHISESVYLLGNHYFQAYLVRGESCALVEGGVTWSVPQVIQQLEELKIAAEELQYLIIPHAHFDHVCGVPGLKGAFPHLQVLAPGLPLKYWEKKRWLPAFSMRTEYMSRFCRIIRVVKAGRKSAGDCSGGSTGEEWPTIRWVTSWFVRIYWCAGPWRMWESENG